MVAPRGNARWEYCKLYRHEYEPKRKGTAYYGLVLEYYGARTETVTLSALKSQDWTAQLRREDPWGEALGQLGLAGWELVALVPDYTAPRAEAVSTLAWGLAAYFKRPVRAGRAVNEPAIALRPVSED